jgi:hypothetical protein
VSQVSGVRTLTSSMPSASMRSTSSSLEQRALLEQRLLRLRVDDVGGRRAAEDALAQRLDDLAAFDQRLHRHAVVGAAIVLGHDQVLRHVDQAPRQVARVRRLERRCPRDPCARRAC